MLNDVENGVNPKDLSQDSELKRVEGSLAHRGLVVTLPDGNRMIVKTGSEVFIPKSEY
jgi:hypothetical protein